MTEFTATWGFRVHSANSVQLAKQTLDDLLRGIAKREVASDAAIHQIPILHIWEMNTSGSQIEKKEVWQPMAEAINVCLQAYPAQSLLVLVGKR